MARPYRAEVPAIKRYYQVRIQPLRQSYNRRVCAAKREVSVLLHQVTDATPILGVG